MSTKEDRLCYIGLESDRYKSAGIDTDHNTVNTIYDYL